MSVWHNLLILLMNFFEICFYSGCITYVKKYTFSKISVNAKIYKQNTLLSSESYFIRMACPVSVRPYAR